MSICNFNICISCIEKDCKQRSNNKTSCNNLNVEVFSCREYIKNAETMEKATEAFLNGWPAFIEGRTRIAIKAKGLEAPESGFVSSKDFKQCYPQEALELLKARAAKERN